MGTVILYTWPSRQVRVEGLGGKLKAVRFIRKYKCITISTEADHTRSERVGRRGGGTVTVRQYTDTHVRADFGTHKLKGWRIKLKHS